VDGGTIVVLDIKPEGKKAMDACSFINGFRPEIGEKLG
jgi:methionyl-tRNA formyltransferase